MTFALEPLHDCVLIRRRPRETQSAGGIYMPDTAAPTENELAIGEVLAVGPGRELARLSDADDVARRLMDPVPPAPREPLTVKPGDVVAFMPEHAREFGKDQIVLREHSIVGILRPT